MLADPRRQRWSISKGGGQHTLQEVGQSFQVTRERIRQIESKALRPAQPEPQAQGLRGRRQGDVTQYQLRSTRGREQPRPLCFIAAPFAVQPSTGR